MDETEALAWLASKTTLMTLFVIATAVGVTVEAVKTIGLRLPRLADFDDWWILGAALGAALGFWAVEHSAAGAVVGVIVGMTVTGGHQYLSRTWNNIKPLGIGAPLAPGAPPSSAEILPIGVRVQAPAANPASATPPAP